MKKKLIIYLGNFDKPEISAAGKRVFGNALIFSKLGYKVVLIGKNKSDNDTSYPILYEEDIDYYAFPNLSLYKTTQYINYVNYIIEKVGNPESIIRYGSPGLATFDRKLITFCKKKNISLIADVVDWLPSGGNSIIFNLFKKIDTYLEKGVFNKKSDGIITISSFLSNYYKNKNCKTVIIPPVVSKYRENKESNPITKVVYAGIPFRLGRRVKSEDEVKDRLDLAVRGIIGVIRKGVSVTFDIYGITKEQYLTAYPTDAEVFEGMDDSVRFHGKKSMGTVQDAVNTADFTILLRNRNRATMAGFPTKIVESISCGTPVITTNTSDLDKYIDNTTGFFVDISSEKKIIDDLKKIFSCDNELLRLMKKNCFESKKFCADMFEDRVKGFITELENK